MVSLVKENLQMQTLAIGDGANDVNMIQTADIGIGISGQEGMQAVMASDFAIARFRFLKRLLLVHGHWCYQRLASMALYMFYKDTIFILLLFWFQLFNGFSGSSMVDQLYQMLFNLTMTSLPPIIIGLLDRDINASTLMANPVLYRDGQMCNVSASLAVPQGGKGSEGPFGGGVNCGKHSLCNQRKRGSHGS